MLACSGLLQLHDCCLSVVLLRFLITGLQKWRLSASGAYPQRMAQCWQSFAYKHSNFASPAVNTEVAFNGIDCGVFFSMLMHHHDHVFIIVFLPGCMPFKYRLVFRCTYVLFFLENYFILKHYILGACWMSPELSLVISFKYKLR